MGRVGPCIGIKLSPTGMLKSWKWLIIAVLLIVAVLLSLLAMSA
jgi:hypothetical protein